MLGLAEVYNHLSNQQARTEEIIRKALEATETADSPYHEDYMLRLTGHPKPAQIT